MAALNLLEQLSFYGAYHSHWANVLIHLLFVPAIWWSACVFLCYSGPLLPWGEGDLADTLVAAGLPASSVPEWLLRLVVPDLGLVAFLLYSLYYLTLDLFAGITYAPVLAGLYLSSSWLVQELPETAWQLALGVHVLSWFMQIVPGHLMFEGRKPALTDSFFQSLILAPLFTWFELLFLVGYRPELAAQLKQNVQKQHAQWAAAAADTKNNKKD